MQDRLREISDGQRQLTSLMLPAMSSETFPTPDYSHLSTKDFEEVYEPAEDTFLLLDALQQDVQSLRSLWPLICLEVGCGSGVVITFLKKMLQSPCLCIAIDKNPKASLCARQTSLQNLTEVEALTSDLVGPLRLEGSVDVLIFNPPYVVTPSEEVHFSGITSSWAGGADGREVLDELLPLVTRLLSPSGFFYLVTIKENKPEEIQQLLEADGLQSTVLLERRSGPERLSVIKFERKPCAVT